MSREPTKRFSGRVALYSKFRPTYPKELISELKNERLISEDSIVAEIGSGTGIFTKLLLRVGCTVYAVEPNDEMREAAEKNLAWYPNFISTNGQAEATTLERRSVDMIAVAQAFHWFSEDETKREFKRILKPTGNLVVVYNTRQTERSPLMNDYDQLLKKYCPEYEGIAKQYINLKQVKDFCGTEKVSLYVCNNFQTLNFEGLKGRLFSSSYSPNEDQVGYQLLLDRLEALFEKHQENGLVQFLYQTEMYYCKPVFPDKI